jgi:hypothetical protein
MLVKTSNVVKHWVILVMALSFTGCSNPSGPQVPDNTVDESIEYSVRAVGPAGGYIFYENPDWEVDGWRYLELAPAPAGGDPSLIWGPININVATAAVSLTDMNSGRYHPGSGKTNTDAIVLALGNPGAEEVYAAWYADQLVTTYGIHTFDDWYLPAPGEWRLIYEVLYSPRGDYEGETSLGGLLSSPYWSSSQVENRADLARYINLGDTSATNWNNQPGKNTTARVRAIRKF